jgi:hypothetical protein
MPDSATIIREGEHAYRLQITHRDWMLLSGPGFVEGRTFLSAVGIFENFTVARGIPKGPYVHRDGQTLFDACSGLLAGIRRDLDLLCNDYSYKIGSRAKRFGGGETVSVNGRPGILSLRPKGYCSIGFVDEKTPDLIDLRAKDTFLTDGGEIRLYRRKADSRWLDILPPLLDFLGARLTKMLTLQHIDRVG